MSTAYQAGKKDGDGSTGWLHTMGNPKWHYSCLASPSAMIHLMGSGACAQAWGVPSDGPAWEQACSDYDRGVRDALLEGGLKP